MRRRYVMVFAGALLVLAPAPAAAQPAGPVATALQSAGATTPPQAGSPSSLPTGGWSDGFFVQSANGDYRLQAGLLLQADARFALDDEDAAVVDTFAIRRLRPSLRGRVARYFEFFVNPDFAGSTAVLQDAYLDTRFSPAFVVRVGKSKTPFGLERLQSVASTLFYERALPSAIAPNRDLGIQVFGDVPGGRASYALALLNGAADGASVDLDSNDGKDVAGRLVVRPFGPASTTRAVTGLTIAVAATTGTHAGALPTLRTSSLLQTFAAYTGATADGRLSRYSPQASFFYKRTSALAEYIHTQVPMRRGSARETVSHDAWQIAGSYALTADSVTERGIRPAQSFDPANGHFGALQVAARYHALVIDDDAFTLALISPGSSRKVHAWTVGLNWYLNPQIRYIVNVERSIFDDGAVAARHAEHALACRAQISF